MPLQGGHPGPSMPEDPGGQTSTPKATKSAPSEPPSQGSSPPRPQAWGSLNTAVVVGVHPVPCPPCGLPAHQDGVPTPQGPQMHGGLRRLGSPSQSPFRTFSSPQRTPAEFPSSPPWQPRASQVWTPRVCGLVWPLSRSTMVSRFVCVSLLSAAEWTPLCTHTMCSSPMYLPTLGGLTV